MAERRIRYSLEFDMDSGSSRVLDENGKALKEIADSADDVGTRGAAGLGRFDTKLLGLAASAGLSAAAVISFGRGAIDAAAEVETLETRLVSLKGSEEAAAESFRTFRDIAETTPFELRNVVEAGVALEAFGAQSDATLKGVTDLAAFMGTDVVDAAQSVGRAWAAGAGAADVLRERGVLAMIQTRTGIDDLTKLSLPEFRKVLYEAMVDPAGPIEGATDRLARTWTGAMSNSQDAVFNFRAEIGTLVTESDAVREFVTDFKERTEDLTKATGEWIDENRDLIDQGLEGFFLAVDVSAQVLLGTLVKIGEAIGLINSLGESLADFLGPAIDLAVAGPPDNAFFRAVGARRTDPVSPGARERLGALGVDPLQEYLDSLAAQPTPGPFLPGQGVDINPSTIEGFTEFIGPRLPRRTGPDFGDAGDAGGGGGKSGRAAASAAAKEDARLIRIEEELARDAAQASFEIEEGRVSLQQQRIGFLQEDLSIAKGREASDAELLAIAQQIDQHEVAILEHRREILATQIEEAAQSGDSLAAIAKMRVEMQLVNGELERGPGHAAELTEELDPARAKAEEVGAAANTFSVDLGDAFRRLTTGGSGFDFLDGLKNAWEATLFDMLDSKFNVLDVSLEQNFVVDIPGYLSAGLDKIKTLWGGGLEDLDQRSKQSADGIFRAYDDSFQRIGDGGSQLSQALGAIGPSTTINFANSTGIGNLAGGRLTVGPDGRATFVDSFQSRFTGPDPGALVDAASLISGAGQADGGDPGAGFGAAATGGAALLTALAPVIQDALRKNDTANLGTFGERNVVNRPEFGFSDATTIGAVGGLALGASIGGAAGPIGAVVGAVVGGLAGLLIELFGSSTKSTGDVGGEILSEAAERDRFIVQQAEVSANDRTGLGADYLFLTPPERAAFFTGQGFGGVPALRPPEGYFASGLAEFLNPERAKERSRVNPDGSVTTIPAGSFIDSRGNLFDASKFPPPTREAFNQAQETGFAVGSLFGQGNANFTVEQSNIVANNLLFSQIEFEEEIKRQGRKLAEAGGFDLFSSIEQLATDFTKSGGQDGFKNDLTKNQFASEVAAVVELFSDDLPVGVDASAIALRNLGERSVNTGVLLKEFTRAVEIFGDLATGLEGSLKQGLTAQSFAPDPASLVASGASIDQIVGAVGTRRAPLISTLIDGIRDSVRTALIEDAFDAAKETPAWQALHTAIAAAVGDPAQLANLPDLINATVGQTLPILEANQQAFDVLNGTFSVTPSQLVGGADQLGAQIDAAQFGRLNPKQQRRELESKLGLNQSQIDRILADDVVSDNEAVQYRTLLTERGDLGLDLFGLSGSLGFANNAAGRRQRAAFEDQALGIAGGAEAGLREYATAQLDAYEKQLASTENLIGAQDKVVESNKALVSSIDGLSDAIVKGIAEIPNNPALGIVIADAVLKSHTARAKIREAVK